MPFTFPCPAWYDTDTGNYHIYRAFAPVIYMFQEDNRYESGENTCGALRYVR